MEWPVQAHLDQADLAAIGHQGVHGLVGCLGAGAHHDDDLLRLRMAVVIEQAVRAIGHGGKAVHGAAAAVGGGNCARVDFIVQPDGEPVFLELNTLPGMTPLSDLPRAAAVRGIEYDDLVEIMLSTATLRNP